MVAFRTVAAPGIGVALRKLERVAVDLPRVYCGMQDRFVRPFPHNPSCAVGAAVRGFLDGLGGGRRP